VSPTASRDELHQPFPNKRVQPMVDPPLINPLTMMFVSSAHILSPLPVTFRHVPHAFPLPLQDSVLLILKPPIFLAVLAHHRSMRFHLQFISPVILVNTPSSISTLPARLFFLARRSSDRDGPSARYTIALLHASYVEEEVRRQ
jgi:hypothetical protein